MYPPCADFFVSKKNKKRCLGYLFDNYKTGCFFVLNVKFLLIITKHKYLIISFLYKNKSDFNP